MENLLKYPVDVSIPAPWKSTYLFICPTSAKGKDKGLSDDPVVFDFKI